MARDIRLAHIRKFYSSPGEVHDVNIKPTGRERVIDEFNFVPLPW